MIGKSKYRDRFNYGSKFIDNNGVCVYCGARANTLDHFVPLSVLYMANEIAGFNGKRVTLECCSECNRIAGSNLFKTVAQKRSFIQKELKDKYRVLLETPNWTKNELEELGYNLKTFVSANLVYRDWIDRRLTWRNTMNPAAAKTAKIRLKLGERGKNSVRRTVQTSGTTEEPSESVSANGKNTKD